MKHAVVLYESGNAAADALAEMVAPRAKRSAAKGPRSPDVVGEAAQEAAAMLKSRNFDKADAHNVLSAYAVLHNEVYGVAPGEIIGAGKEAQKNRAGALSRIRAIASKDFSGDFAPFLDLLRFTWTRERFREEQARKRNVPREGGRISWRIQFCESLLTEWKVDLSRRRTR